MSQAYRDDMRKQFYDKFAYYRAGRNWDRDERRTQGWGNPQLPLKGKPFVDQSMANRQKLRPYARRPEIYKTNISRPRGPISARSMNAYNALMRIKNGFGVRRKFEYKKVLGWGGNGLATQFQELDDNNQPIRQVAVKMPLKPNVPAYLRFLEEERAFLMRLRNAEHIIQIVDVPREDLVPRQPMGPDRSVGPFPAIIMELAQNGDLYTFICKVREHGEAIPNHILWQFFLCLIRGCIAMAYPPMSVPENSGKVGPITETVPPGRELWPEKLVHFDLDPTNVFLDEIEKGTDKEHKGVPVLKTGDFGLARDVPRRKANWFYENLRFDGKHGWFSPEQFCNEWDYIEPDSGTVKNEPVAGNFGSHTNVWQVGLIMEALITRCNPAFPPVPSWTDLTPPWKKNQYLTYGLHLEGPEWKYVDPELRYLVYRCQAHIPADRPALHEAEQIILKALKKEDYDSLEWRKRTDDWIKNVMFSPSPASELPAPPLPPGVGALPAQVPVYNAAPQALPRPPGAWDIFGNYYPSQFNGRAIPCHRCCLHNIPRAGGQDEAQAVERRRQRAEEEEHPEVLRQAAEHSHPEVLKQVVAHSHPATLKQAAEQSHPKALKQTAEQSHPKALKQTAEQSHPEALKQVVEHSHQRVKEEQHPHSHNPQEGTFHCPEEGALWVQASHLHDRTSESIQHQRLRALQASLRRDRQRAKAKDKGDNKAEAIQEDPSRRRVMEDRNN
ncbi:kinase-like domain-containing protein [Hypoxylon sp. FL0890]|nr:kinase-like domain-containing protein [Hypoxylon sp. FL0890]